MKKSRFIALTIILIAVTATTFGCEIKLRIPDNNKKQSYSIGDELIVEVEVVLTHGHCHVPIDETKFRYQGIEILGSTPWKRDSQMKYTRKIKVKITEDRDNKSILSATRTCHKEGGYGSIEIERK